MLELIQDAGVCVATAMIVGVALMVLAAFIEILIFELRGEDDFYY
jgi:hypothetical protein